MKKYMVVYQQDLITCAVFFDEFEKAQQFKMDCECGMGWYAEVYERKKDEENEEYVLLYA